MEGFLDAAMAWPTAVWTVLLVVTLVYWLMAIVGMVDFESTGIDIEVDMHADGEVPELGTLASYVVGFGLSGVPFSIVVSLIVLVGWTASCLAGMWLLPLVPAAVLKFLAGAVVLVASGALAIPVTAALVRPMRGLFVYHTAVVNAAIVGQQCKVLTQTVDDRLGRAEVARRGASLNIRVWALTPNTLRRGAVARIVEYDEATGRYLIQAET